MPRPDQKKLLIKVYQKYQKYKNAQFQRSLEEYELIASNRNEAILMAYRSGGYTLVEISQYFHCIIQR